jgi:GT2 family glycosyltransferase
LNAQRDPLPDRSTFGIVVIGRNEGERLRACLQSVTGAGVSVVYVDSGSSDGSSALAASSGAIVLELDSAKEFSAARARNEGFQRLADVVPALSTVQFVDGDCNLAPGWIERAVAELSAKPEVVIVCGRVQEKNPEASIYNRLCALEWQKDPGEIPACGGIFVARADAFRAVGGFRSDVMAAEEDELCLRLRRQGGKIVLLDVDMALHDAAMMRFSQWWRRARRAGLAYAQGAALHGSSEDRHFVRDCRRLWFWGLFLPLLSAGLAWPTRGISAALLLLYPLLALRIYGNGRRRGWSGRDARLYAIFTVLAKFPGLAGMLAFHLRRWRGKPMTLIEHKQAGTPV